MVCVMPLIPVSGSDPVALHSPADDSEVMRIVRALSLMRKLRTALPRPVVLVPTMGALHAGHLVLVDRAKKLAGPNGSTVATIFVNPTQFGPREDFREYPRPCRRDCLLLRKGG